MIRAAFQNNFCRGLTPFSNKASPALVKKVKIQTIQFAVHCSKTPVKLLKKHFLQEDKPPAANMFPPFLNLKTKTNTIPYFLALDLRLNNLSISCKQKEQVQNQRNSGILKKKFVFCGRSLVFVKIISKVFNKVIRKNGLYTPWPIETAGFLLAKTSRKEEQSLVTTLKKPKKGFFSSKAPSSLVFDIKNKKSPLLKVTNKRHVKNQETDARWFTFSGSSSLLADQKRRFSQMRATDLEAFKGGELFGGYLVRADWVLGRFIEQLSKKKMNPRAAINQQINDIRVLIDKMGSECPIKGMRIVITGRLSSRKKAMAQQISKCVGKVPLSTFWQKVDYRQDVLSTRFGLVGIKIWVCYANIPQAYGS